MMKRKMSNGAPCRVLVLEDQPDVLRMMGGMLARHGCDVALCQEIEAAETLLSRQTYAALVTDLNVSARGGAEGLRLARFCRTHFPDCRVVIVSGNVTSEARRMARELGISSVLDKPVTEARLAAVVLDGVHGRGHGAVRDVPLVSDVLDARVITGRLQPIVHLPSSVGSNDVFAVEGLARGPADTILARPDLLLEYASRKGLGAAADLQCIEAVLEESVRLQPNVPIFLNIQPRSLSSADFAERLIERLDARGYPISRVVLEITEHETIVNPAAFRRMLDALRQEGFRFALDDYGEGVSNLLLLQCLQPEFIKLSSRLTANVESSRWAREMLRSTAELADTLGVDVIVEGIETAEQVAIARSMGVRYAQGYHFARPGTFAELENVRSLTYMNVQAS